MPALSKKQQKFMGIVRSIQKGEQPASKFNKDAQDVAKDMKKKDVKKFASTKHKGLPVKKEVLNKLKEMIKQELSEYTYGTGDVVKDVNPSCPHYGAMGKVKSVNPRSVIFIVKNKGKNFKPGMELEKSHDQMKKMNETINEITFTPIDKIKDIKNLVKKGLVSYRGASGGFEISIRNKKVPGFPPSSELLYSGDPKKQKQYRDIRKKQFSIKPIATYFIKSDDLRKLQKFGQVSFLAPNKKESVNEMSAKTKKIINKLGKKEKEMFIDMVDMLGFDQVMADYKRDKKAFKQALKDMSESVIQERNDEVQTGKQYTKLWLQSINSIIKQANSLKGQLSKHPIKRDLNKLKAVENLFKKFVKPAIETAGANNRHYAPNQTELKKYLSDSKFKIAVRILKQTLQSSNGYDENSWYYLGDKEQNLIKKMSKVLYDIENKMDKANLENINEKKKMFPPDKMTPKQAKEYKRFIDYAKMGIEYKIDMSLFESINEDGHTDVASAKRKAMLMVEYSNKLLNKLNGMNKEDSLPSWLSDKITLASDYLHKATHYLLNPVESVNEARLDPKQTLQQLGGNRFIAMTGAKNLAVDKSKNELHMKIMRNAKGISHVRIRLTSMDLYDMEFLQVRAGRIKIKSKEKGVYGDQLGKMFKKNTGLNVRL